MQTPSPSTPVSSSTATPPDWVSAPGPQWRWRAQDADGQWFWYSTQPQPNWPGGVWRSNSRHQQLAGPGEPNPDWLESLEERPA